MAGLRRLDRKHVILTVLVVCLTLNFLLLWLIYPTRHVQQTVQRIAPPLPVGKYGLTFQPSPHMISQCVQHCHPKFTVVGVDKDAVKHACRQQKKINQSLITMVKVLENREKKILSFLLKPVVNHIQHAYTHNPRHACVFNKTDVLFVIPSSAANFENRVKVRNSSIGQFVKQRQNKAAMLFFLGKPPTDVENIQRKIDVESGNHGDIVQENFLDVYSNIRLKALSMLYWAAEFCPQTTFVIRADDDVKVFPDKLVSVLRDTHSRHGNFILGNKVIGWEPIRKKNSKYYLSEGEYPHSTLPPFALGGLLGYPICTVWLLYQAALRVRPVWLDDVYVTGICAPEVGVPVLNDTNFGFKHWDW
ncbi:beta-1,3-galactosyltransferase 5-like [Physella acuta]|uniref:beta-1,3-galactosyltransferase 5-like n=1 Tax=Physella acuta TaxID=109671 RepID=UPI0027DE7C94|nr:beta-1,3-galactosyltransferase 5-like [Physella acuta]